MLLESDCPGSKAGRPLLDAYFPKRLRDSFAEHFEAHALKKEIIATVAVNTIVNNTGITFFERVTPKAKGDIGDLVASYLELDASTGTREKRKALRQGDAPAAKQQQGLLELEDKLEAAILKKLG
jgi:glutamate dehydrogenase